MNFSKVTKSLKKVTKSLDKHLPAILTGLGAVGTVTGAVLAAKAGIESAPIIEERRKVHVDEKMTKTQAAIDTVKHVGKYYIPSAVIVSASVVSIIGAHKINSRRIAALSTALIASREQFKDYKDKAKEILGEKKESKIATEAMAQNIEQQLTYLPWDKLIEGEGPVVYCDLNTGKLWKSDPIRMTNAINEFNKNLNSGLEDTCCIREWYDMFEGVHAPAITDKMVISPQGYHAGELPELDRMTTTGPCIGGFAICYLDYDYILDNGR